MIKLGTNNIGKLYLGSNPIGKAYLGSSLVFQRGGGPQPTTAVSYIRGGGDGSYIDTGIKPSSDTKIIVWARNFNPAFSAYNWLCGAADSAQVNSFMIGLASNENTGKLAVCYRNVYDHLSDKWGLMSNYHKYELSSTGFHVDDVLVSTVSDSAFSGNQNIHLFGCNIGGVHNDNATIPRDICACKIYNGGTLVRNYTAVNSPSVGLYDSVSGTLFANAGSGSFTYGTFNTDAYEPLEYISTNGASYFDSGILGSNTLDYVCRFMTNITTISSWAWPFGCQTTVSTKRFGFAFGPVDNPVQCDFMYASQNLLYVKNASFNGSIYVAAKDADRRHTLAYNNGFFYDGNAAATTFTTDYNINVCACNNAGTMTGPYFGRVYYLRLGLQRNFVPALVNGVVGMYDTYNDTFYSSASSTPFTASS